MIPALPSSFTNYIRDAIERAGEMVTFTPVATGVPVSFKASVQSPVEAGLTQDAQQQGFVVFISAKVLSTAPLQFDRLYFRGSSRALEADAAAISLGDETIAWQCRVTG